MKFSTLSATLAVLALMLCASGCDARDDYDPLETQSAPLGRGLRPDFLFGAASAAHQVEGGLNNDWSLWERSYDAQGRPRVRNADSATVATDSWNRFDEDLAALQSLGANSYRLSVEWSRLEPIEGVWNHAAALRYRTMLESLRRANITPFVTVHHFTLPQWVAAHGGWEWSEIVPTIERFTGRVAATFGDLVDHWITINEPTALMGGGYAAGVWPPGVQDNRRAMLVYATLLRAHGHMAQALRQFDTVDADHDGRNTNIGLAHNIAVFEACSSSAEDRLVAGLADELLNEVVVRAASTGNIRIEVPGQSPIHEYVPELVGSFDYLGINYYRRIRLCADLARPDLAAQFVPSYRAQSDMSWEIYARGLEYVLHRFSRFGWPIYITENGIADANDARRADYLRSHVYAMERAIAAGVDLRGYFHWSLTDNFEWAEGYNARFGLFSIDPSTLQRRPRRSAEVFRSIVAEMANAGRRSPD